MEDEKPDIFTEDGRPKKGFKSRLDAYLKNVDLSKFQAENIKLKPMQIYPSLYMMMEQVKGLYVNMGLGRGKSLLSIHCAHLLKRHTIVLLPSSIKNVFLTDIAKYYGLEETNPKEIQDKVSAKFTLISSNSPYVAKELEIVNQDMDTSLKSLLEIGKNTINPLDNKFLIIDEAHRLTSTITGGSDNGLKVMRKIMNATNLKIMLMSATPIINDPFELVPAFAMLYNGAKELFPSSWELFNKNFMKPITIPSLSSISILTKKKEKEKIKEKIKEKTKEINLQEIKNKHIFQERITGMVSYYPGIEDLKSDDFPEKMANEFLFLKMEPFQWGSYLAARILEQEEENRASSFKSKATTFKTKEKPSTAFGRPKSDIPTSYKVKTRMISNFAIPTYVKVVSGKAKKMLKQSERNVLYRNYITQIKDADLKIKKNSALKKYSCKFFYFMTHIPKIKGKIFAYSNFISIGGLGMLEKIMKINDYTQITSPSSLETIEPNYKNFVSLTGNIDKTTLSRFLDIVNLKENDDGKYVKILLVSSVAAGGLNLKSFREVHFFDFDWNYTTMMQLEGRVSRFQSHITLPKKERNYKVYYYFAVQPKEVNLLQLLGAKEAEGTTDVALLNISARKKYINDQFLTAMKEVAMDCSIHGFDYCRDCVDSRFQDKEMFPDDFNIHSLPSGSKCLRKNVFVDVEKLKKKLKKIFVDGNTYYIDENEHVYDKLSTGEMVKIGYMIEDKKKKGKSGIKIKKIAI